MRETTSLEKKTDMDNFFGQINLLTVEILLITTFMDREGIGGLMVENTMAIGNVIRCMVKVFLHGQMVVNMMDNIMTIRNKVMEYLLGQTVDSTMVIG